MMNGFSDNLVLHVAPFRQAQHFTSTCRNKKILDAGAVGNFYHDPELGKR